MPFGVLQDAAGLSGTLVAWIAAADEAAMLVALGTALGTPFANHQALIFLYAQGLVPREDQFLVAMPMGTSWRENLMHGVYYEPVDPSVRFKPVATPSRPWRSSSAD